MNVKASEMKEGKKHVTQIKSNKVFLKKNKKTWSQYFDFYTYNT